MTTPDDNPFAPPSYSFPSGAAFSPPSYPPPSDPAVAPPAGRGEAPQAPVNGSARRAMLLASLTPVLTPVAGLAAVALGRRSRKEISETGERGLRLARAATGLGATLSILWVLGAAFLIAIKVGSIAS